MADMLQRIFKNKKVNFLKLASFGFEKKDRIYEYSRTISDNGFRMTVNITESGKVLAEIIDPSFNEKYTLHLVDGASGSFVGAIKDEYEKVLTEIADKCFEPDVFKSEQAGEIIDYVRSTYGDELEFLWDRFPDNAIWRRKDTGKWYCALLTVSKRKLGIECDETAEIIDLRIKPDNIEGLIDNRTYFPGYHMNKKHWYTIILDSRLPTEELCRRIDESYLLAVK